jgi:hypothetical protein
MLLLGAAWMDERIIQEAEALAGAFHFCAEPRTTAK